jgi:hypothetical protein
VRLGGNIQEGGVAFLVAEVGGAVAPVRGSYALCARRNWSE